VRTALGSGAGFGAADGGLSQADQTAGRGPRPFLVFNPLACGRRAVVEATVWDDAYGGRARELQRAAFSVGLGRGRTVAAQTLDAGGYWGHDYVRVAFPVDVEGFGWTTAVVKEGRGPQTPPAVWHLGREHHCAYTFYERGPEGLENRLVRLEIDPGTGGIRALVHKASGVALIGPERPAPLLEYAVERPHPMSAWTVDHTGAVEFPRAEGIRRVRKGPWVAALEVRARIRASEFTVTYEVRADDPAVYLRLAGTWFERGTPETGVPVLRMAFPLALQRVRAAYEIPFGALERDPADGVEVPALRWARVAGRAGRKPAGCLLLNDSKHGHAMSGRTLRLTLIRSSYEPDVLPEIGRHEVQLALRPWAGACPDAEAIRLGQAFTHPLRVVSTDIHRGVLPARAWMARVTGRTAIVSALKKAETEDALILRLFEPSGTPGAAGFDVNPRLLGRLEDATPVDLMERPLARTRLRVREGRAVSVPLPAHGIASVRLRLQRR
jgi:alpha-mannosidase